MKYISFILLIGVFFGFKSAIKNEFTKNEIAVEKLVDYGNLNKNLLINSKEDLQGFWVYDGKEYDDDKYYGKFILLFDKISIDKIEGKLLYGGEIIQVSFNLLTTKNSFKLSYSKKLKGNPFRSWNLEINKGTGQLQGKMRVKGYEDAIDSYVVSIPKVNFVYNPDVMIESYYVDYDKTGMGYREYSDLLVVEESIKIKEIVKADVDKEVKKDSQPIVKKIKPAGEYREGYYATTNVIREINPSIKVLRNDEVENLSKADLYILRNAIFAKHGMIFKNKKLKAFFMQQPWYIPITTDVTASLTEIEKKNIDLMSRYEQNAKEYFQVFGR